MIDNSNNPILVSSDEQFGNPSNSLKNYKNNASSIN